MIPDQISRLLAAFIDKELDTDQRQAVIRLARRSRRVRALLLGMHLDSRALRSLATERPGQDFSEAVLRQIADEKVRLDQRSSKSKGRVPSWAGLATAAAVLIALGAGIYGYRVARQADKPQAPPLQLPEIAQLQQREHAHAADVLPGPETTNRETHARAATAPKAAQQKMPAPPRADRALPKSTSEPGTAKSPSAPLVGPTTPEPKIAAANVAYTLFVPLRELKQDKRGVEILDELSK